MRWLQRYKYRWMRYLICWEVSSARIQAKSQSRRIGFLLILVGAVGFELTTLCSQSRCATRLRYAPKTETIPELKKSCLTEATSDVILGFAALWLDENLVCFTKFHQFAQVHIGGVIRTTGSLLHVVRHDHDGIVFLEFSN